MIKRIFLSLIFIVQFCFLKAGIVVLNGLSHSYQVENGKVYKGKIEIENTGNQPQSVKLFLQDYSYKSDGTINYSAPHTNIKTNTDWIKLNTNLLTLKAKQKTEVYYEINVPDHLSEPGSYWSVIMVEPVEEIKPNDNKQGVNITSIIRYAIQVITDFDSEKAKRDLAFEGVKIEKEEGKQILKVAIANRGNLYCKPTANIEIYNKKTERNSETFQVRRWDYYPKHQNIFILISAKCHPISIMQSLSLPTKKKMHSLSM